MTSCAEFDPVADYLAALDHPRMAEAAALCALIRATCPDLRGVDVERSVRVDLTALIRDWMAG